MILKLLNTPELPAGFNRTNICGVETLKTSSSLDDIQAGFSTLKEQPSTIIGSKETPALHWFMAKNAFPQAALVCCYGEDGSQLSDWVDLNTGDALGEKKAPSKETQKTPLSTPLKTNTQQSSAPEPVASAPEPAAVSPEPTAKPPVSPKTPKVKEATKTVPAEHAISSLSDGALLNEIFKFSSWGLDIDERRRKVDDLIYEGMNRQGRPRPFTKRLELARLDGIKGHTLGLELKKRVRAGSSEEELQQWVDAELASLNFGDFRAYRMQRHLTLVKNKALVYQQKLKAKGHASRSQLKQVEIDKTGVHPNSLQSLSPCAVWDVLIDETGNVFELDEAEALNSTHNTLGKVVALVLAQGYETKLPKKDKFHATEAKNAEIDSLLNDLLSVKGKVGIIGFSMKDATKNGWLSQIEKLIRTVIMLLPIKPENPVRINFNIEQRSGFTASVNLIALEELIITSLTAQFPQRFDKLHISLSFITKDENPYNAYVDTLAHMWGSPAAISKDRLKKSALLGHCLLRQSDQQGIEKLTWILEDKRIDAPLRASEWFKLCEGAKFDLSEKSLLSYYLTELGKKVKTTPDVWNNYLDYIQKRISAKDYDLVGLGYGINWLSSYQPEGTTFTPMMELHHSAASLALANHQGRVLTDLISTATTKSEQYINELLAEDAIAVANLILKIAVATTNAYAFDTLIPIIKKCLSYPVEVFGLLTYSKLQSQLAQLYAFTGQDQAAEPLFSSAIEGFKKLSNKAQAGKEILQTTSYQLIHQMKLGGASTTEDFKAQVVKHLSRFVRDEPSKILKLATSGDLPMQKYPHHLMLRAMVLAPSLWQTEIDGYLAKQANWQQGESHPWALILAYRAWLMLGAGNRAESLDLFKQAIALCQPGELSGPTVEWIGLVITGLAKQLHPQTGFELDLEHVNALQHQMPGLPTAELTEVFSTKTSLTHVEQLAWLEKCLPFNFH